MKVTRFGHSCLLVEDGDARLLLDPGSFSFGFHDLRGLTGVLVTHAHPDHLDVAALRHLLAQNPDAALHLDEGSAHEVGELPHTVVQDGDRLDLGTSVDVVGRRHAVIHPDLPVIPNVGYLVGERFFTPGDALTVPEAEVELLGLPAAAPWLKASEAVELMRAVRPRTAFPVHDASLSQPGVWYGLYASLAPSGTTFRTVGSCDAV